jgi:hypothetical protein
MHAGELVSGHEEESEMGEGLPTLLSVEGDAGRVRWKQDGLPRKSI